MSDVQQIYSFFTSCQTFLFFIQWLPSGALPGRTAGAFCHLSLMICWITIGLKNKSVLCFSFSEIKFSCKAQWIHIGQCWCSGSQVYLSPSGVLLSCFQLGQLLGFFTFIFAGMMLCFYYGKKTVLITHRCFSSCQKWLHRTKSIMTSHTDPPARSWGHEELGAHRIGTADPTWPKGHPRAQHHVTNDFKTVCRHCVGEGWASISRWWAISLCITWFVNVYYNITVTIILLFSAFSMLVNSFYCNLSLSSTLLGFFWFSAPSHWERRSELCYAEQLQVKPQRLLKEYLINFTLWDEVLHNEDSGIWTLMFIKCLWSVILSVFQK